MKPVLLVKKDISSTIIDVLILVLLANMVIMNPENVSLVTHLVKPVILEMVKLENVLLVIILVIVTTVNSVVQL